MIVRKLLALLGFEVDHESYEKAEHSIEGLKETLIGLAEAAGVALTAHEIYEMVEQTAELGSQLQKTSLKLNISTRALQELQFAAGQAEVSSEELQTGLRFLARNAGAAASKGGAQAQAFAKLGVNVRDANGNVKSAADLIPELADAFKNTVPRAEQTAVAIRLFGRSGAGMIPFLLKGSKGIADLRKEAEELGGVMDEDMIERSENLIKTQKKLAFVWQGLKNVAVDALLPAFTQVTDAFIGWLRSPETKAFMKQVPIWIGHIIKVAAGLWVILDEIFGVLFDIGKWVLSNPLGKLALAFGAVAIAMSSPTLAIVAFLAALGLLVDDLMTFERGSGRSLIWFVSQWAKAFSDAIKIDPNSSSILRFIASVIDAIKNWRTNWNDFVIGMANDLDEHGLLWTAWHDLLIDPIEFWGTQINQFQIWLADKIKDAIIGGVIAAFSAIQSANKKIFNFLASGNFSADVDALRKNTLVSSPGAASLMRSLAVENKIDITVNGGTNPQETGKTVGDAVQEKLDWNLRKAKEAFDLVSNSPPL